MNDTNTRTLNDGVLIDGRWDTNIQTFSNADLYIEGSVSETNTFGWSVNIPPAHHYAMPFFVLVAACCIGTMIGNWLSRKLNNFMSEMEKD